VEEVYRALLDSMRAGQPVALVTLVQTRGSTPRKVGAKMLVRSDGSAVGTVGGGAMEERAIADALSSLEEGRSRLVDYSLRGREGDLGLCGGDAKAFIEVVQPRPTLLIAGAGHIGQSLAKLGALLDFRIVVADDREGYATLDRVPSAGRVETVSPDEFGETVDITRHHYVVIATRSHEQDAVVLRQVVESPAAYIGLIGSRRKVAAIFDRLLDQGVSSEALARVHAPIGLDIGAATPDEIAMSILAEILMVNRGGTGQPLSEKGNPLRGEQEGAGI